MSSRLSVGVCTTAAVPANDTMPSRTFFGSSWMKDRAAACAASRRFGSTSVACMLRDTSIASAIVMYCDGSVTVAVGARGGDDGGDQAQQHQRGRHVAANALPGADRVAHQGQARIADGRVLAPPQHQDVRRDQRGRQQQEPEHVGPQEPHRASQLLVSNLSAKRWTKLNGPARGEPL